VVFDAWRQKDTGAVEEPFTVRLSPDGVGLFLITP
jgi:hypothetical protein